MERGNVGTFQYSPKVTIQQSSAIVALVLDGLLSYGQESIFSGLLEVIGDLFILLLLRRCNLAIGINHWENKATINLQKRASDGKD